MRIALVSVHGLKNELYSCVARSVSVNGLRNELYSVEGACFSSWIKERVIFMRSALVSVNGLKNQVYSCVARLFWLMD